MDKERLSVDSVHVIRAVMARNVNVTAHRVRVMSHWPNVSSKFEIEFYDSNFFQIREIE